MLVLAALISGVAGQAEAAPSAEERGYEVFAEADRRISGYGDMQVALRMILRTANGRMTQRSLRISQMEMPQDGDRVLLVFDSPANIRGTALLSHAHLDAADDQWLFLPAIKRVKKIAARNKSGPFVGSEFSFEDLRVPELEKYTYRFVGEQALDGVPCFQVQRRSKEEFSGYDHELHWIDQNDYRTLRVDYFNQRGEAIKRLDITNYELYQDKWWKAGRMFMQNLRSGRSTELHWQQYSFGTGLQAERDLSVNSLRRAR